MTLPWKAPKEVTDLMEEVKSKNHDERLATADVLVWFDESKPFVNNSLNLGKAIKLGPVHRVLDEDRHNFLITLPSDVWHNILVGKQREAWLDLHLTRFTPDYKPQTVIVNGRKRPVKDQWGRIEYTTEVRTDKNDNVIWKVLPLDLEVYTDNIGRYGLWLEGLTGLAAAISRKHDEQATKSQEQSQA